MHTRHISRLRARARVLPKDSLILGKAEADEIGGSVSKRHSIEAFPNGTPDNIAALLEAVNEHVGCRSREVFNIGNEGVVVSEVDKVRILQDNIAERTRQWHAGLNRSHEKCVTPTEILSYNWVDKLPQDLPPDMSHASTLIPSYNPLRHRIANEVRYRVWAGQRRAYTFKSVDGPD